MVHIDPEGRHQFPLWPCEDKYSLKYRWMEIVHEFSWLDDKLKPPSLHEDTGVLKEVWTYMFKCLKA